MQHSLSTNFKADGDFQPLSDEMLDAVYGGGRLGDAAKGAAIGGFSGAIGGAAGAASIGGSISAGAIGGGVAGAVGGGIRGGLSSGGGSKGSSRVICTHFFQKGMMERDLWRADLEFTFAKLPPATIRGYQYWAIPYVRLMRRSKLAERIMYPIAKYRAIEIAHQLGLREKGSVLGKIIRLTFEPTCFLIGQFVGEQDWQTLWAETSSK